MGARGTALELGVELATHVPRVAAQLQDLHQLAIRGDTTDAQPVPLQSLPILVVELEAVAVALVDHGLTVFRRRSRAGHELTGVRAEPHSAAHIRKVALTRHQVNHRVRGIRVNLGRVCACESADVAGELDSHHVHPVAEAQVRHVVLPCVACRGDLALDATRAEATGHNYA